MLLYWNLRARQSDGYSPVHGVVPVKGETLGEACQRIQVTICQREAMPCWWFWDVFHWSLVLMNSHGMIIEYRVRCSLREARHILRHQA